MVTAALLASPVSAQVSVPPVRQTVDANGVDLFRGVFTLQQTDLAMGSGASVLAYTRSLVNNGWRDSLIGGIDKNGTVLTVSIGDQSESFNQSGTTYSNNEGSGSTLTLSGSLYTYTTTLGVVGTFDRSLAVNPTLATADKYKANEGRLTKLRQADGHQQDYAYALTTYCAQYKVNDPETCIQEARAIRLEAVKTNSGYQIVPGYVSDAIDPHQTPDNWYTLASITGENRVNCSGVVCDPGTVWPAVSFSTAYSAGSTFTNVTDPKGSLWRYRTDGSGLFTGVYRPTNTGPSPNVDISYYTSGSFPGRVSAVNRDGRIWTYAYTAGTGTLTTVVTDPLGHTRTVVFNTTYQQPTSDKDGLNRTYTYEYDTSGRLTKATAPLDPNYTTAQFTSYIYDGYGNVTNTVTTQKGGGATIATSAAFNSCPGIHCGKPDSTTDARGNATAYIYDGTHGGLLTTTQPAPASGAVQPQTRVTYSSLQASYKDSSGVIAPSGLPIALPTKVSSCLTTASCDGGADETKAVTTYATATNLLPQSIATGSGDGTLTATTNFAYDGVGNATSVDGPLSGSADTTVSFYNTDREQVGSIGPDPDGAGALKNRAVRTTYNADGQVTMVEQGTTNGQTSSDWSAFSSLLAMGVTYDAAGLKTTEAMLVSGIPQVLTQYSYDGDGRQDCVTQRMNPATFSGTQPAACTPGTSSTTYGPDRINRTEYDAADEVTKVWTAYATADAEQAVRTTYTSTGRVQTVKDGKDNLTTYTYDSYDRPYQLFYPNPTTSGTSSSTDFEQRGYDATSNVTSHRRRNNQTITYGYDNLNRLVSMNQPTSYYAPSARYQYNNLGWMTVASEPSNARALTFGYDALGRQTSAVGPFGNTGTQYDLAGRRTFLGYGDGFYVTYDRLVTGELTAIRENGAASGVGVLAQYSYDLLGRRTALLRGNGLYSAYGYDDVSRMNALRVYLSSGSTLMGYGYNPASQITTRTTDNDLLAVAVAPNVNRTYTTNGLNQYTAAGVTITYNTKGSTTKVDTKTYEYNPIDQLVRVNAATSFYHDALGRIDYIETSGTGVGGWLYDGTDLIAEKNTSTGTVLRRYVHGDGMDEPLVWYEGSGTSDRRFLSADERGSIVAVTNGAGGTIAINGYDEWGLPGSGNIGRFQYTGQKWIPELQAYDYKARIYHPLIGRFLQIDPGGFTDSLNLYGYTLNDPINFVDPSGLRYVYVCVGFEGILDCGYQWVPDPPVQKVLPGGNGGVGDGGGTSPTVPVNNRGCPPSNVPPNYPVPPGFTSAKSPKNMLVRAPNGRVVTNPNFQRSMKSFTPNFKGVINDFASIFLGSAFGVGGGAIVDLMLGAAAIPAGVQTGVGIIQGLYDAKNIGSDTAKALSDCNKR